MGSPAEAILTSQDEYQIGRMIVRGLRDSDQILEDPEVTEYVQSLGGRLSSHAHDGSQRFTFFMAKENTINAFALPGGFIGVNTGLVLETKNESELAGVVAHEIAHVTQRHIARSIAAQSKNSLVSTAAMLAAILIGAASGAGGDARGRSINPMDLPKIEGRPRGCQALTRAHEPASAGHWSDI